MEASNGGWICIGGKEQNVSLDYIHEEWVCSRGKVGNGYIWVHQSLQLLIPFSISLGDGWLCFGFYKPIKCNFQLKLTRLIICQGGKGAF